MWEANKLHSILRVCNRFATRKDSGVRASKSMKVEMLKDLWRQHRPEDCPKVPGPQDCLKVSDTGGTMTPRAICDAVVVTVEDDDLFVSRSELTKIEPKPSHPNPDLRITNQPATIVMD